MASDPAEETAAPGAETGSPSSGRSGSALGRAIAAGLVAAIAGGVVWGLIVRATDYEVGFVAWAVGFLVGTAVALAVRRGDGTTFAVVAVVLSLLGILLGKYLSFAWVLGEAAEAEGVELSPFSSTTFDLFMEDPGVVFSAIDLLFVGLAVFSAWSIVKNRLDAEPDGSAAPAT